MKSSFLASWQQPPTSPTCTLQLILIECLHKGHVVSHTKGWQVYISEHVCLSVCLSIYAHAWRFVQPVRPGTHASKQLSRTGNVVRSRKCADSLRVLALGSKSSVEVSTVPAKMLQNKKAMYNKSLVLGACGCWSLLMLFP